MLEFIFLFFLVVIVYVYAGYAACAFVASRIANRKPVSQDYVATVSIIISAYNEEKVIVDTLRNKLQIDYPRGHLEIIVVSDGSDDNTDKIVKGFESDGVKLIRQTPRQGKTAALNRAAREASGEILLFSDANSKWQSDAVKKLIRKFSDPIVGYVTGKMVYTNPDGTLIGDGCSAYMKYENFIRKCETGFASVIGVDGGIDGIRKKLYIPMNPDQLPDFVLPLSVIERGYRVAYEPEAILNEEALTDQDSEFRMRTRVTLRALWAIFDKRNLLNPMKYPVTSWQLISHKLLRYITWLPLAGCLVFNLFLHKESLFYGSMLVVQGTFYLFAGIGYLRKNVTQTTFFFYAPYYFLLINTAAAIAFMKFLRGEKQVLWKPRSG